ncbi:MAG: ribonuclease D [Phyllobacteriaceae bacterium]|nr:ribonuclease D [Phyllobacteriaceae bacterium]
MPDRAPQKEVPNITTTEALAAFCAALANERFVTVDTEFLRETTYYPKLCLIQIAGSKDAALVDPLAKGIDLAPFYALMADTRILKVFHAARQDVEILLKLAGAVPSPIFDTQIAAMVCGFGDQVGYEAIVRKLVGAQIDKSSQFTDWSRRPLTHKQMAYALSDVTHLRTVYEKLMDQIERESRSDWLEGELEDLANPAAYRVDPEDCWRRIKARIQNKKQQATLMAVAAWRERQAQLKDVPRGRILKDEAIGEIAIQVPQTTEALHQLRLLPRGSADSVIGKGILEAVAEGLARDPATIPAPKGRGEEMSGAQEAAAEILKLALKIVADRDGIAPKLIASSAEIDAIAVDDEANVPAMQGWRRDVFGELALDLKHGRAAIAMEKGRAQIVKR